MKKVREEERRNVIINWLSKKKKKKKSCDFQCLSISYTMIDFKLPPWWWGMWPWNEICTTDALEPVPIATEPQRLVVPNRFIEMCSTQLVIREMKIRTTAKDHLTPVSVAIIRKMKTSRCWWVYGEKGSSKLLVGIQTCTAIERNCVGIPHKVKNKTTKDSVALFHSPSLLEMVTAYISERHYWLLFIFAIPIVWRVYYSLTCMANVNLLESKTFLQEKKNFLSTYLCSTN